MTILRLTFAGQIKKVEIKDIGSDKLASVSICRKQKGKGENPDTFCWVRVNLWNPAEFQLSALVVGAFIAGSGELSTRAFTDKDGKTQVNIEVRCTSFDVEVSNGKRDDASDAIAPARPAPRGASGASGVDDPNAPPFAICHFQGA